LVVDEIGRGGSRRRSASEKWPNGPRAQSWAVIVLRACARQALESRAHPLSGTSGAGCISPLRDRRGCGVQRMQGELRGRSRSGHGCEQSARAAGAALASDFMAYVVLASEGANSRNLQDAEDRSLASGHHRHRSSSSLRWRRISPSILRRSSATGTGGSCLTTSSLMGHFDWSPTNGMLHSTSCGGRAGDGQTK
jgi:hypothetical protein